ncbi:MAG: DNA/RNA non-specific endonuclease [Bacteroidetes bacterium]|nr:DNA/RNA non-specific endonuclease [Bacteroidota bacterium]
MLVSVNQLKRESNHGIKTDEAYAAADNIVIDNLVKATEEKLAFTSETSKNILSREENLLKRKEMISAIGFEPSDFAYERAIGENDSLYSNFTELIALTKRKVGRIVIREDNKTLGYATGFMVSWNLMLTNWHVFKNKDMATESEVYFFYEYDAQGHPLDAAVFKFDTRSFFNDMELDYCFVGVQPFDISDKISLASIGYLYLDKTMGKIGEVNVEKLNIIHHPQGDYKQISIRENKFVGIDNVKLFYETDTAPGSSGSPVFNDQWQVVGLHHKSIAKMTTDGNNYIDKDGNIIPIDDDKIDIAKIVWEKNEGIRISVILKHLNDLHHDNEIIKSISILPPAENLSFEINTVKQNNNPNNDIMKSDTENNILITIPSNFLNNNNSIDISLSGKKTRNTEDKPVALNAIASNVSGELLLEVAKADKEMAVDFDKCNGYDPTFLGVEIPMPQPKKEIVNQIALLKDKTNELTYFNYSVIFNALRKMPLISAINSVGDASKRLDNSKRKDDWLRDKRIDIECQLTDKFYANSKFDKGHMGRFEDANWGDTEKEALRNGIYTCFYTNACPQSPGINRMGDNLWGNLEKAILEKGIKKEKAQQARITVFNGPVFDEQKDRIRLGVMVPMQFFKIVLWLNDDNKLRATAFKLTQEKLVTDDQFDEAMLLGEEALDIDKLLKFKPYQCSIKLLSSLTKIDFSQIETYDTYKADDGSNETLLINSHGLIL